MDASYSIFMPTYLFLIELFERCGFYTYFGIDHCYFTDTEVINESPWAALSPDDFKVIAENKS